MPSDVFIAFLHGYWCATSVWDSTIASLPQNMKTVKLKLKSTGTSSPNNPSMLDDIADVQDQLREGLKNNPGSACLLVAHSGGGIVGNAAAAAFSTGEIAHILYLAGAILPKGVFHDSSHMPAFDFQVSCASVL